MPLPKFPSGKNGFTSISSEESRIDFTNRLTGDMYLTNAVAHNGSGLAIGDIDGDGLPDIFFCNLQGANALFKNLGHWRFQRLDPGPATCSDELSTGAAFADLDGDGDLDLLVNGIAAGTRLFLNDGAGNWNESSNSGLSKRNSATSMALADIDGDGDLDLYCAHYIDVMHLADPTTAFAIGRRNGKWEVIRVNGESTAAPKWKNRFEALPDGSVRELPEVHALYRNDGKGHFTPIQNEPGTFQDQDGKAIPPFRDWGLAAMFRDVNRDGAPDLYVCNDNASPDRFWINNGNGTFRAADTFTLRHTSRSSMGLDFADIDRDGRDDFLVVDMFARTHAKRMTELVKQRPDPSSFEELAEQPRFNRNMLFLGRADGSYAETAFFAGVAASDWSWCPIFLDVDLDGYEDLLISNGFSFDVMDQDSHDAVRQKRLSAHELKRIRQFNSRFPSVLAAFRNKGNGTFEPAAREWGFNQEAISYGMALGDFDGDGDLDLAVNRLNEAAGIYRNEATAGRIAVRLKGEGGNTRGIGARIRLIGSRLTQEQEMIGGGRYLSGDENVRVFASAGQSNLRLEVRWPDARESAVPEVEENHLYEIDHASSRELSSPKKEPEQPYFTKSAILVHRNVQSTTDASSVQPLLPHRIRSEKPIAFAVDLNEDGWDDLILGSSSTQRLALYVNESGTNFALASPEMISRMRQSPLARALTDQPGSGGTFALADIDGDGDLDFFASGTAKPGRYPEPGKSFIWTNENGEFRAQPASVDLFKFAGSISGAVFADLDGDRDPDLVVSTEWGPIRVFQNDSGRFKELSERLGFTQTPGLWTSIAAGDFDGDGHLDLVAGNWGLNTPYALSGAEPIRLYYGDWDQNGIVDLIEAWRMDGKWIPVRDKTWLARGLPELAQRFKTHGDFARATMADILGANINRSPALEISEFRSSVFLNRGARFDRVALPREAQFAPVMSISVGDLDGDGIQDLFAGQNFLGTQSDLSREDSGEGLWLRGHGDGTFSAVDSAVSGIQLHGEQSATCLLDANHDGRLDIVVAQQNAETVLYLNNGARP